MGSNKTPADASKPPQLPKKAKKGKNRPKPGKLKAQPHGILNDWKESELPVKKSNEKNKKVKRKKAAPTGPPSVVKPPQGEHKTNLPKDKPTAGKGFTKNPPPIPVSPSKPPQPPNWTKKPALQDELKSQLTTMSKTKKPPKAPVHPNQQKNRPDGKVFKAPTPTIPPNVPMPPQ